MTMVPLSASSIIALGGVSNIIKGDWVIKVFSVVIFGGFMGGWYVKSLLKEERMHSTPAGCLGLPGTPRATSSPPQAKTAASSGTSATRKWPPTSPM